MIKVAICDDEISIANELHDLICKHGNQEKYEFFIYDNGNDLLLSDLKLYDMVFLDIELGDMCGIDVGNELKKVNKTAILFYVTNHANYISEALRQTPFQFILKPLKEKEKLFIEEFNRGLKKLLKERNVINVTTNNGNEIIKVQSIQFIECLNRKLEFHLQDKTIYTSGKIKDLKDRLLPYGFEQCHVSYLLNLRYVSQIKGYNVYLFNGDILSISKRYLTTIKESFAKYLAGILI